LQLDLQHARGWSGAASRAHSRNVVAVAVAEESHQQFGIDIEWESASRDIRALAEFLVPTASRKVGSEQFYRLWTFAEACFKAFQAWPPEEQLLELLDDACRSDSMEFEDGTAALFCAPYPNFQLSLVWSSEACAEPPIFLGPFSSLSESQSSLIEYGKEPR
jgi:hypothetical protein